MKIVAIGGGEIGRPGTQIETEAIDRETIRLSGKKRPRLLFLPTASGDSESYCTVVRRYFGNRLGCDFSAMRLLSQKTTPQELAEKVFASDIIYVGGGNTLRMLKLWRRRKLDAVLMQAAERGIILSGVSAGAICWFRYGNSDSRRFTESGNAGMIRIRGLDLIPLIACPHYDAEADRPDSLRRMILKYGGRAIALQNCSALFYVDGKYRILTSSETAQAYLLHKQMGKVIERPLPVSETFDPFQLTATTH